MTQVKGTYQQKYCLTSEHVNCPLFQAAHPLPPPAAIAAAGGLLATPRRKWMVIGIPAILASSAAFFLAWNVFGAQLNLIRQPIPDTGKIFQSPAYMSIIGAPAIPKQALLPRDTPTPKQEPTPTSCPRPDGWVPYLVNPTDSLYRLSVIYGVAIEQLQNVNCMGSNTYLKPGDIIFVPELPTPTPSFTPTVTPIPPTSTSAPQYAPAQPTAAPQHEGQPAAVPPTAVPPTAVPPTAVPPAAAPAVQDQPKPPAKQDKPPSVNPAPKQDNNSGGNHSGGNNKDNGKGKGKGKGKKGGG